MATDFEALLAQCRGPLTFTAPMVLAVLDGRKTQTRRVIHSTSASWPTRGSVFLGSRWELRRKRRHPNAWQYRFVGHERDGDDFWHGEVAPRFAPGDLAYVAEGLRPGGRGDVCYNADLSLVRGTADFTTLWHWNVSVLSSRFMPKRFARTILRIDEVRAERVQDITEEQAIAEGIPVDADGVAMAVGRFHDSPRDAFAALWATIHPRPPHDWASNPWCFVYAFATLVAVSCGRTTGGEPEDCACNRERNTVEGKA